MTDLKKDDYESYLEQVESQIKMSQMTLESHKILAEWLKKKCRK